MSTYKCLPDIVYIWTVQQVLLMLHRTTPASYLSYILPMEDRLLGGKKHL